MNRYAELRDKILALETDFRKFYEKENKAAGTRVRKGLQELKSLSQNIRMEIQQKKNDE